jgi:hypothetical protein
MNFDGHVPPKDLEDALTGVVEFVALRSVVMHLQIRSSAYVVAIFWSGWQQIDLFRGVPRRSNRRDSGYL